VNDSSLVKKNFGIVWFRSACPQKNERRLEKMEKKGKVAAKGQSKKGTKKGDAKHLPLRFQFFTARFSQQGSGRS